MADLPAYPGTPGWVKVTGIVVLAVVLLFVVVGLVGRGSGGHGPGRHAAPVSDTRASSPAADRGGHTPPGGGQ